MDLGVYDVENKPSRKNFDWISEPRPDTLTPFQQFIVDIDWEHSPLGPMNTWPAQLRHMVLLVVANPTPAVVYWGREATIVYNEPYTQLIGQKHPHLQGQDPRVEFAEIWDHFERLLAEQRDTGLATVESNAFLLLQRYGFLEETYFSWQFVPIIGDEGSVVGSYATVVEVTRQVISDRRLSNVRALSLEISRARTIKDLWGQIVRGLEHADKDVPLALLYSVRNVSEASNLSSTSEQPEVSASVICTLEGSVGISHTHGLAPNTFDFTRDQIWLSEAFQTAIKTLSPVPIPIEQKEQKLLEMIEWRGYGVPSSSFIVCPIVPTQSGSAIALLVIALNPRRPFDEDYQSFIHMLTEQVTTPQVSAFILREEVERRQFFARQQALDRERLSRKLSESETKFARFATRAPVGLAILTDTGIVISANDLWKDLTQLDIGSTKSTWENITVQGDLEHVERMWNRLLMDQRPVSFQARIKRPWRVPDADFESKDQWTDTSLLVALYPDLGDDKISTVMSCITDISELKWSETQLRQRMDQAIEMKKQQERFIDMTSHEMRNPLSALISCADDIVSSLNEFAFAAKKQRMGSLREVDPGHSQLEHAETLPLILIYEAIEAADTIIYCAMHQKRIIDDILTLSRLDSNLLLVCPEASQPIHLVRSTIKMFEVELKRAVIILNFVEEDSLQSLQVQWTSMDASRILQVLINLMTNAIKFTRNEAHRHIMITMGASLIEPSEFDTQVEYVQRSQSRLDQTMKPEWGNGQAIYLVITVKDTGRGLSEQERKNLFQLFQQASPKTHIQYGGSGLGLFISRQLVEMHGGMIGVASERSVGSTFRFYVKTRRTSPPIDTLHEANFELLLREDALREACSAEIPGMQTNINRPNVDLPTSETAPPLEQSPFQHSLVKQSPSQTFHVLVVEDNLVNQKVAAKQLRRAGHIVTVANHGEEALAILRQSEHWDGISNGQKLSVILMDVEMPVMDGITCIRKIRELQALRKIRTHVPVIAVTANTRKDQILNYMSAGMDDVTTKPYRIHDILKQIENLVLTTAALAS